MHHKPTNKRLAKDHRTNRFGSVAPAVDAALRCTVGAVHSVCAHRDVAVADSATIGRHCAADHSGACGNDTCAAAARAHHAVVDTRPKRAHRAVPRYVAVVCVAVYFVQLLLAHAVVHTTNGSRHVCSGNPHLHHQSILENQCASVRHRDIVWRHIRHAMGDLLRQHSNARAACAAKQRGSVGAPCARSTHTRAGVCRLCTWFLLRISAHDAILRLTHHEDYRRHIHRFDGCGIVGATGLRTTRYA